MSTHRVHRNNEICKCPNCDVPLNSATNADGEDIQPAEGDTTICAYCGTILTFNADLSMEEVEEGFMEDLRREFPEKHALIMDIVIKIKSSR